VVSGRDWFGREGSDPARGGDEGGAPPAVARQRRAGKRGPLVPTLVILLGLGLLLSSLATFWTEILWYESVGFRSVFTTALGAKLLLGVLGGLLTAAIVASSLVIAYRNRPIYAPTPDQEALERYREAVEPLRRLGIVAVPLVLGVLSGLGAAAQWQTFLLWRNQVPFGKTDPQFNMDIGFFVFTLPWLTFLVGFLGMALIMGLLAAAFTHYVYGGLQLTGKVRRTTSVARLHLSGLLALIVLVRAASYWLERYSLSTGTSELMTGIQYTDAAAVLPTKAILAIASIMCALMFLSVLWTKSWRLPIVGLVGLLVVSVVAGGIVPALVQSLKVKPSEKSLESPYLTRNIAATRDAYGLTNVDVTAYDASTQATPGQLRNDAATVPGIRIVDPNVVSPTFKQLAAKRNYYQFPDALDVDRYNVDDTLSDTVIAARELDLTGVPAAQRNWLNDHTVYTHGFGLTAAYGNKRTSDGGPVFIESDISSSGKLGQFEPRIYFGEQSPAYSIVGAPAGAAQREFDFPDTSAAGQANNTYAGTGGVPIGSLARKLAYGLKYREANFLLSDAVNDSSRLLDHRSPRERVDRVAPWLELDGNAYPAVADGRVVWIIDGYTTSANYPNSRLTSVTSATSDSITRSRRSVQAIDAGQINYIRNSVKATVDAFDGSVHLYAWDATDPMLKAWSAAFPGTVEPRSNISASLMSHLRYPEDLFKVQRQLLAKYHVTDPDSFYGGQDFWKVPADPTQEQRTTDQPAYYLTVAMPGQAQPQFSLTTTFMPVGDREILSGFLAVDSNAGSTKGSPRDGYGKLRLLVLPKEKSVKGPGQVQNEIGSSNTTSPTFPLNLSQSINSYRQEGSSVTLGNLLTLPVGGGLLYVEPVYVQAKSTSSFPLSKIIVVAFGDKLAWSDTLDKALDGLFGGDSGAQSDPSTPKAPSPTPSQPGTPNNPALQQALADAQQAVTDADAALKAGDFAKYGDAQKRLREAISRAVAASPQGGSVTLPAPAATTPAPAAAAGTKPSATATAPGTG